MAAENNTERPDVLSISPRDILFECPACGKSLVVDQSAEGLIIDCPQCHINVIVPPKKPFATPAAPSVSTSTVVSEAKPSVEPSKAGPEAAGSLQERLAVLSNQLKEMQTQRTEISNRLASRLNEISRDLVMLARLETTQQQIVSEWNQLLGQLSSQSTQTTVLGSSVGGAGRTRVQFRS